MLVSQWSVDLWSSGVHLGIAHQLPKQTAPSQVIVMSGILDRQYWPEKKSERIVLFAFVACAALAYPWIGWFGFMPAVTVLVGWAWRKLFFLVFDAVRAFWASRSG